MARVGSGVTDLLFLLAGVPVGDDHAGNPGGPDGEQRAANRLLQGDVGRWTTVQESSDRLRREDSFPALRQRRNHDGPGHVAAAVEIHDDLDVLGG